MKKLEFELGIRRYYDIINFLDVIMVLWRCRKCPYLLAMLAEVFQSEYHVFRWITFRWLGRVVHILAFNVFIIYLYA